MRIWIIRGNREYSRAQLRPINIRRDAEWNDQIRWRKLIESDARWFQLPECKTIPFGAEIVQNPINDTTRQWIHKWLLDYAGRNSPPNTTSPECTSGKLRRRNWQQRNLGANYNSEIETDLWRSHRRYAADELFTKEPLRAEYRSRQDIRKNN